MGIKYPWEHTNLSHRSVRSIASLRSRVGAVIAKVDKVYTHQDIITEAQSAVDHCKTCQSGICHIISMLRPVMLDSGRGKHRLEQQRDGGSLKVFFKGTKVLGASAAILGNDRLLKKFQRFRQGAHPQE